MGEALHTQKGEQPLTPWPAPTSPHLPPAPCPPPPAGLTAEITGEEKDEDEDEEEGHICLQDSCPHGKKQEIVKPPVGAQLQADFPGRLRVPICLPNSSAEKCRVQKDLPLVRTISYSSCSPSPCGDSMGLRVALGREGIHRTAKRSKPQGAAAAPLTPHLLRAMYHHLSRTERKLRPLEQLR